MDAIEALTTRRSHRAYTGAPVSDADVETILRAAMSAPTAGNERPYHFIVVRDRKMLADIPKASPYAGPARNADVVIVVCGVLELEKYPGFWSQDCCNAAMNILTAAHALGLGAVWTAAWPMEDRVTALSQLLGIPAGVIPLCVIPIGHPKQLLGIPDRYEAERIHKDRW